MSLLFFQSPSYVDLFKINIVKFQHSQGIIKNLIENIKGKDN